MRNRLKLGAGSLAAMTLLAGLAVVEPARGAGVNENKEIFNFRNRDYLCPPGAAEVGGQDLALTLFQLIKEPLIVTERVSGTTNAERARNFFLDDDPYDLPSPSPETAAKKEIREQAKKRKAEILTALRSFLGDGDGRPAYGYHVERTSALGGADPVLIILEGRSGVRIRCGAPSTIVAVNEKSPPPAVPSPLRIRGRTEHLSAENGVRPSQAFKAASSAEVAFTQNEKLDNEALELNGVVGYAFSDKQKDVHEQYIPYLGYRASRTSVAGGATDKVEVANVGLLYDRFQRVSPGGVIENFKLGLFPVASFDLAQKAETVALKSFVLPGVSLGGFRLAQDNDVFGSGWLFAYPDVKLTAEARHVLDAGENPNLRDDDFFAGFGVEPELKLALDTGTAVDRLRLTGAYRFVRYVSGEVNDAERLELGLDYLLDDSGNFKLRLEYVEGEQEDTLQLEKSWGVKLGLKF